MADWVLFTSVAFVVAAGGGAFYMLYPLVPSDLGGAENLDAQAKRLRLPVGDGGWVAGWLLEGRRPATILVLHGYGRNHHRAWRYAQFLNRAGYHVMTIDFRSSRYRERKPTTLGHFETADAQAAIDWLRQDAQHSEHRIGVLAESLGAAVALILTEANPDIEALVVDCPFATGQLALEESLERWARLPRQPGAEILRTLSRTVTGLDPNEIDPLTATRMLQDRPVFFIHSEKDNRFSVDQTLVLWDAAGSKDPMWLIPGIGHNEGWKMYRGLYEERVTAFYDRHLFGEGAGLPPGPLDSMERATQKAVSTS